MFTLSSSWISRTTVVKESSPGSTFPPGNSQYPVRARLPALCAQKTLWFWMIIAAATFIVFLSLAVELGEFTLVVWVDVLL